MEHILSVKNLKTSFFTREGEVKAVDGISFDLAAGKTLGIVGESGCGKSVANLSIMRLIPDPPGKITGGEVFFEGRNLLKLPEPMMRGVRGNRISMIFQDPMTSLNPFLKISRQMTEVLEEHRGLSGEQALKQAIQALDVVGIPSAASRIHDYPHQFSGGMRQRVMIAMGLLCQPKMLIADEPTTALDVTIQAQILELLKDLQEEFGMAIILVTHDLGVAATLCENIAVMYAGRIVEYGSTDEIFANPRHPYTVGLLESVPRLDAKTTRRLKTIPGQPPDLVNVGSGCPFAPRCTYAIDRCRVEYPSAERFAEGHFSHCWRAKEVTAKST
ncbi:MAG: ABC transporter ATP-binding protein [Deltaproteobacteria bacterium]|nr:ABC transporter ATP-binding protein [Deltaproteobacteria bacterium]